MSALNGLFHHCLYLTGEWVGLSLFSKNYTILHPTERENQDKVATSVKRQNFMALY